MLKQPISIIVLRQGACQWFCGNGVANKGGDKRILKAELECNLIISTFHMTRTGPVLFIRQLLSGYFVPLFVPITMAKQ
jgi:hypothetical protein